MLNLAGMINKGRPLWRFTVGAAMGLVFNLGLTPILAESAHATPCMPATDGGICPPDPGWSPEHQAAADMVCGVWTSLFADGSDPAGAFGFDVLPTTPGSYYAHDYLSRQLKFNAVWAGRMDLKQLAPELYQRGVEAYMLAGTMVGPAGSAPLFICAMDPAGLTADTGYVGLIGGRLDPSNLDMLAVDTRIAAGPRVVDASTTASVPLSDCTSPLALWANASDTSTFYNDSSNPSPTVDPACVRHADETYRNCVGAAASAMFIAAAAAALIMMNAIEACLATLLINPLVFAACEGAAWFNWYLSMAVILALYLAAVAWCSRQHVTDLRACGVNINEI